MKTSPSKASAVQEPLPTATDRDEPKTPIQRAIGLAHREELVYKRGFFERQIEIMARMIGLLDEAIKDVDGRLKA